MRKTTLILLIVLLLTLLSISACSSQGRLSGKWKFLAFYKYELIDVERSDEANRKFQGHRIIDYAYRDSVPFEIFFDDEPSGEFRFTDDLLDIFIVPCVTGVNIQLQNTGRKSISIIWADAVFQDAYSQVYKLRHIRGEIEEYGFINSGKKKGRKEIIFLYDKNPTVILAGGIFKDYITPDIVAHEDQEYDTSNPFPMLPQFPTKDQLKTKARAIPFMDSIIKFMLPIEYDGVRYEYTICLKVNDIESRKTKIDYRAYQYHYKNHQ